MLYSKPAMLQFVVSASLISLVVGQGVGSAQQSADGQSGTIKFGPPDLSNEIDSSYFMPDQLKCDACRAIAYQLWSRFKKFNEQRKQLKYDIPESELIDLVEDICVGEEIWKDYGLKEVNQVPRLDGPGLDTREVPGVTAQGGKWPGRLRDMCESFIGEIGESSIYAVFRGDPKKRRAIEDYLCRGKANTITGSCQPQDSRKFKVDL